MEHEHVNCDAPAAKRRRKRAKRGIGRPEKDHSQAVATLKAKGIIVKSPDRKKKKRRSNAEEGITVCDNVSSPPNAPKKAERSSKKQCGESQKVLYPKYHQRTSRWLVLGKPTETVQLKIPDKRTQMVSSETNVLLCAGLCTCL